jgi:hypothetical protein
MFDNDERSAVTSAAAVFSADALLERFAVVRSFKVIVKVSPTFRARGSSNSGRNWEAAAADVGNKLPAFDG